MSGYRFMRPQPACRPLNKLAVVEADSRQAFYGRMLKKAGGGGGVGGGTAPPIRKPVRTVPAS